MMRSMLALLVLAWTLLGAAFAEEVGPRHSVVTGVVVRAAASTHAARRGLLAPGQTLPLDGEEAGWWRVRLPDGALGYVAKRWTQRIASPSIAPLRAGEPSMFAHFVYVGQGAGAILEFPCGVAIVDTGGQYRGHTDGGRLFADYLDRFFDTHPQFHNTIDVLFTTHPHADHLKGLSYLLDDEGVPRYTIRNVVDDGKDRQGSELRQAEFRDAVRRSGGRYEGMSVSAQMRGSGVSDDIIDPIDCGAAGDPSFHVLWGGWSASAVRALGGQGRDFNNPNEHSLVLRVDFGASSFLFTGDLEAPGIHDMLAVHGADRSAFDVDVYEVGHHGSANATTSELLAAMTPRIAIISVGNADDRGPSTAWDHGHPRDLAIDLLQTDANAVSDTRAPVRYRVFRAEESDPVETTINRAIYATGWEGDLVLRATSSGHYAFVHPGG